MKTAVVIPFVMALLSSCGKMEYRTNAPSINLFGFEESQVHHIHSNLNPEAARGRIFLVRYDPRRPRDLEWINCPIEIDYKYHRSDALRIEEMQIRSSTELQARLPLSIARYQGIVESGSELLFQYVTVGAFELAGVPALPKSDHDCSRATHYVTTLSVGAFAMAEQREHGGAVGVDVGKVGAGGSHHHSKGQSTIVGNLDACLHDEQQFGCRTPLQIRLEPIPRRWWFDGDLEATTPAASPSYPTEKSLPVSELAVSEDQWRPGHFMAAALDGLLRMSDEIGRRSDFGWDSDASTIAGGFAQPGERMRFTRSFKKGESYIIFGWGSGSDVDIAVRDAEGNIIDADFQSDGTPLVELHPQTDTAYEVIVQSTEGGFSSIGVMRRGGVRVDGDVLRQTFQNLLDAGVKASQVAREAGLGGVVFHTGGLSLLGTILEPGQAIRQRGVELEGDALFIALPQSDSRVDIDMIVESSGGRSWKDEDNEPLALVVVEEPSQSETYSYRVAHSGGGVATLAASLVLIAVPDESSTSGSEKKKRRVAGR